MGWLLFGGLGFKFYRVPGLGALRIWVLSGKLRFSEAGAASFGKEVVRAWDAALAEPWSRMIFRV